ncbi:MAG TPA: hypothetical protein VNA19_00840 [Pyrinomonadaceae bacterium]|jgi:biopolymer transport protein ExbD|nr:hypothetical protein [Pyrinomonadaceae bacterium]
MKKLHLTAMSFLGALTVLTGCANPKPREFKELVAEELQKHDVQKAAEQSVFNIIVMIDKEHRVFLNKESVGTVEDISLLKEKLAQALERRNQHYREDAGNGPPATKELSGSKVVFVCAPASFKYGEVVKVIEAIKDLGGQPVGLSSCISD